MQTPSVYQQAIYDALQGAGPHIMVNAVAGSGKTTTCERAVRNISQVYSILFAAFGSDIAAEIRKREVPATIMTYNAMGWGILRKEMKCKLEEDKTQLILQYKTLDGKFTDLYYKYRHPVTRLVSLLKGTLTGPMQAANRLPDLIEHHGIESDGKLLELTEATYIHCLNTKHIMDWDDQVFMPMYLDLKIPAYDYVFVDEFQDTNLMQSEMMRKAARSGRFVGVGDPWQSIYGFRGATPDAFSAFKSLMVAKEYPLSICYRCAKAIVAEAATIVPHIEANPSQAPGSVEHVTTSEFFEGCCDRDMVLCRTVAPLLRRCLDFIKRNRHAYVLGREIADELVAMIDLLAPNRMEIGAFSDKLLEYQLAKAEIYTSLKKERLIERLTDTSDALFAVAETVTDTVHLAFKINDLFDASRGGIKFMSIHKSKGLEADNVWILRPDLLPHPRAKLAWQVQEEERLRYVAITRARNRLSYVLKERNEK